MIFKCLFLKGPEQRFSQQVVMDKRLFLNLGKEFGADSCCRFREKLKIRLTPTLSNSEQNDVIVPNARLIVSKGQFQLPFVNKIIQK